MWKKTLHIHSLRTLVFKGFMKYIKPLLMITIAKIQIFSISPGMHEFNIIMINSGTFYNTFLKTYL